MAVDDRLRQAGRAARVDDPERVVEGDPARGEGHVPAGDERIEVVHRATGPRQGRGVGVDAQVAQQDHVAHARQFVEQPAQHAHAVVADAAVGVAVAADQRLRFDLAKAVEHGHGAHVGRADRPDRAERGGGEEGDDGLRDVRQEGADPVAGPDADRLQRGGERCDLAAQFGPGDPLQLAARGHRLVLELDRRVAGGMRRVGVAEEVLCVVDLGAGEPDGARHPFLHQHGLVRRRRLHAEIVPDAAPEGAQVTDRPAPEGVVAVDGRRVEGEAPVVGEPAGVAEDMRRGAHRGDCGSPRDRVNSAPTRGCGRGGRRRRQRIASTRCGTSPAGSR